MVPRPTESKQARGEPVTGVDHWQVASTPLCRMSSPIVYGPRGHENVAVPPAGRATVKSRNLMSD